MVLFLSAIGLVGAYMGFEQAGIGGLVVGSIMYYLAAMVIGACLAPRPYLKFLEQDIGVSGTFAVWSPVNSAIAMFVVMFVADRLGVILPDEPPIAWTVPIVVVGAGFLPAVLRLRWKLVSRQGGLN